MLRPVFAILLYPEATEPEVVVSDTVPVTDTLTLKLDAPERVTLATA